MNTTCAVYVAIEEKARRVEADELGHPMHIVRRGDVPDTEGAGTFRGAPSIYGEFGPIEARRGRCSTHPMGQSIARWARAAAAAARSLKPRSEGVMARLLPCPRATA